MFFFFFFFFFLTFGGLVVCGGGGWGHGNLHPTLFTQSNPYIFVWVWWLGKISICRLLISPEGGKAEPYC